MSAKIEIYEAPNIMNLKGLTEEDSSNLDNIFENKFTEKLNDATTDSVTKGNENINISNLSRIPDKFTSIEKWPKECLLSCSYCDLIIGGIPTPDVEKIVSIEPFVADINRRYFCDGLCLRTYIEYCCAGQKKSDKIKYARLIYDKILRYEFRDLIATGGDKIVKALETAKIANIPLAPDKTLMKKYSGENGITPEEYRELKEQLKRENKIGVYSF